MHLWFRAASSAAIAGATIVAAAGAWAQAAPTVDRTFASNVTDHEAFLSADTNDGGGPSHVWFEVSTHPDMSNARTLGEERGNPANGRQTHAQLNGLLPGVTHYFRAHIQTPWGRAAGSIETVRADAAIASTAPTLTFQSKRYDQWGGQWGWWIDIDVDPHGVPTHTWAMWSTDPSMAGAQGAYDPQFAESGGVDVISAYLNFATATHAFFPTGRYPNRTIYVRIVARNAVGEAMSDVYSFVNAAGASNY